MKKEKCILIVIELFITAIFITCLVLSNPFYELLLRYIQNDTGSWIELMKNSVGIILSLVLGLTFIWTMTYGLVKAGKKHLTNDEKKSLIGCFFKVNFMPILMIIFSIILFEKCFELSIICLFIIALYSTALILTSIVFSWVILCAILK